MSRLLVRAGVFKRGPFHGGLGDITPTTTTEQPAVNLELGRKLDERTALIVAKLEEQEQARKWTLLIGGASALFAAIKLGIVTVGHIKSRGDR